MSAWLIFLLLVFYFSAWAVAAANMVTRFYGRVPFEWFAFEFAFGCLLIIALVAICKMVVA